MNWLTTGSDLTNRSLCPSHLHLLIYKITKTEPLPKDPIHGQVQHIRGQLYITIPILLLVTKLQSNTVPYKIGLMILPPSSDGSVRQRRNTFYFILFFLKNTF